jgi:hypothetical protein
VRWLPKGCIDLGRDSSLKFGDKPRMKIVADGPQRYRDARDYQAIRRQLLAAARLRYESQMSKASLWRRIRIALRIQLEVQGELEKLFPSGCLHLARASGTGQRHP